MSACGTDASTDAAGGTPSDGSAAEALIGPDVRDVTAPVVGGGTIDLAAYDGQPLALWFWAPT